MFRKGDDHVLDRLPTLMCLREGALPCHAPVLEPVTTREPVGNAGSARAGAAVARSLTSVTVGYRSSGRARCRPGSKHFFLVTLTGRYWPCPVRVGGDQERLLAACRTCLLRRGLLTMFPPHCPRCLGAVSIHQPARSGSARASRAQGVLCTWGWQGRSSPLDRSLRRCRVPRAASRRHRRPAGCRNHDTGGT